MLPKIRLPRNDQVVPRMEEEEAEIVAEIAEVTEADAAEVVIVVVMEEEIAAAQAAAVTKRVMAQVATGQPTKVAETADPIQAAPQPVRIRTGVAAGLRAENPGTRNKLGNPGKRRGSRKLES